MRNQLQTYLLPDDELALSHGLRNQLPTIFFVDQDQAGSEDVTLHTTLNSCASGFAYIWDAETDDKSIALAKWLEILHHKSVECVLVQFLRSRTKSEELVNGVIVSLLLSGRIAMMGTGTEKQRNLKKRVENSLSRIAPMDVYPVSPTTREPLNSKQLGARVGIHATEWCNEPTHLLRSASNVTLYGLPLPRKSK